MNEKHDLHRFAIGLFCKPKRFRLPKTRLYQIHIHIHTKHKLIRMTNTRIEHLQTATVATATSDNCQQMGKMYWFVSFFPDFYPKL